MLNTASLSKCPRGAALVIVLAMLVLVLGLTMAFFSRAVHQRQISKASSERLLAHQLSQTALEFLLHDLHQEIASGSTKLDGDDIAPDGVEVFRPLVSNAEDITDNLANSPVPIADSMLPERAGTTGAGTLFKVSRYAVPFFSGGALRASNVSTADSGLNGSNISPERWLKPRLLRPDEEEEFLSQPPQWVYLNRDGHTPVELSGEALLAAADSTMGNGSHVIGRFAYAVYEVGGLLDINVAGNMLEPDENIRKGRLHQVVLAGAASGMDATEAGEFISGWRSPVSGTNAQVLFDPERDFRVVSAGDQAFVGRQDLLNYALRSGSPIPSPFLPLLTTFSRGLDAPHWEPSPWRPKMTPDPGEPDPDDLNPGLLAIRFSSATQLQRGGDPSVSVPAGTPVMPRRFPLGKLELLEDYTTEMADSVRYFFGLENRGRQKWEYVAGIDEHDDEGNFAGTRIARLTEVADMGREPNFFEILQAFIHTDSLGKAGGNSQSRDEDQDSLRNLQILRIGANIIDQWDADDIPTVIHYPSGNPGESLEVYGTENLPYISQMGVVAFRPSYNRDLFQIWGLFDVWNPHQNAATPPTGIEEFRIIPVSGRASAYFWYAIFQPNYTYYAPMYKESPPNGGRGYIPSESIVALHESHGRQLTFPAGTTYIEPTTIRGGDEPTAEEDFPGLLLVENDPAASGLDPLIKPRSQRTVTMQRILNGIMDLVSPYQASGPAPGENAQGDRVYEPGVEITGFDPVAWDANPPIPSDGIIVAPTAIYANYGVKTASQTALVPDATAPLNFELQARVDGQWRTYQKFDSFNTRSTLIINQRDMIPDRSRLLENTHHAASDPILTASFYPWRGQGVTDGGGGTVDSWIKFDPRSRRWGASRVLRDALGNSPHATDVPWDYGETPSRWVVTRETPQTGVSGAARSFGDYGFQFMPDPNGAAPLFKAWGGAATNNPDPAIPNADHPLRYADRDGVIRPADGYFGARPTVVGRVEDRPVILNRPFRSVGELGYAFRDLPWKTLDFASRYSGDLGLLDVFTLEERPESIPVIAGRVSLNTAPREVLTALLQNSLGRELDETMTLTQAEAEAIATAIIDEREANGPYLHVSDLIPRVFHPPGGGGALAGLTRKEARETAIRSLAALSGTRVWTFLVDLIVERGRFIPGATSPGQFVANAQERTWFHIAVDRITGETLEIRREIIHD